MASSRLIFVQSLCQHGQGFHLSKIHHSYVIRLSVPADSLNFFEKEKNP